jgi:branched-subunit amino acid transport protein
MAGLSPSEVWLVIILASLGTYALRLSFIALIGYIGDVPERVEQGLRFVPPAVLTALVAPTFVYLDGTVTLSPANHQLLAGGVAAVVAWRTESLIATLVAGMGALYVLILL